jgi:tetratricopeptide (TPR) repeat protein
VQYRMAVQADPKRADIHVKLVDAYLQQKDGSNALKQAVIAADLAPSDVKIQLAAGAMLLLGGVYEDAKGRAEKVLAMDPKNVDALILAGNAMAGLKDLDGAVSQYQEALALDPAGAQAYSNIGAIQYSRGQVKEAESTFRKAIDAAPKSVSAHLGLASFLWASKRFQEAEAELKSTLALDPENVATNRALGAYYMATGKGPDAEPYFKKVTENTKTDEAQLALADYYIALGRLPDAKAILEPINKKTNFSGPAPLRLASIALAEKNPTGAADIIKRVLEKTPTYAPARVFNIRLEMAMGKTDQALIDAQALAKDEGNSHTAAEANLAIGEIEASRDRTDEAIRALEEALRIQPQSIPAALQLAQVQMGAGNPDRAETYARQVTGAQPKNPMARAIIVRASLMRNDQVKAAAELASLEKEFPGTVPVLNLQAARDLAAGKPDQARLSYDKVMSISQNNLEALEGLVVIDLAKGRKKEATDRVEAVMKRAPPSADLFVIGAKAYAATGNMPRAEELLRQAIEREPARLAAYGMLGQIYVKENRLADARDQFQEVVKRNPKSVAANTMLGMILEAQQNLPAAEDQYQRTLGLDPNAAVAANNLAWIFVSTNRNIEQALQLALTAQKHLPEEPHVNDTLGWAYYRKGLYSQAVRHLEMSVNRDQSDPSSHYHLGMAYARNGDVDKGLKSLQKALAMNTSFDGADEARKTVAELTRK